jgi:hypothetical protein
VSFPRCDGWKCAYNCGAGCFLTRENKSIATAQINKAGFPAWSDANGFYLTPMPIAGRKASMSEHFLFAARNLCKN